MSEDTLKVVALFESNRRDVSATLRAIADEIDAGKYGEVRQFAAVIDGAGVQVFGSGEDDNIKAAIGLLQVGAQCLVNTVLAQ